MNLNDALKILIVVATLVALFGLGDWLKAEIDRHYAPAHLKDTVYKVDRPDSFTSMLFGWLTMTVFFFILIMIIFIGG